MIIEKKAWPDLFQQVLEGKKKFDLRLADFDCRSGDTLILKEYNPETKQYTGRTLQKTITFVLKTNDLEFWPREETAKRGFIVMSLE